MRNQFWISIFAIAYGASAQSITSRVPIGAKYCHEVTLTTTWTVDQPVDDTTLMEFRGGSGGLEYRVAGPDSILVSFFHKSYVSPSWARRYSSKKILFSLKGASTGQVVSEKEWEAATRVGGSRTPAFSPAPEVERGLNTPIRFRGFEFAGTGLAAGPRYIASPGGDWIVAMSSKGGSYPGPFEPGLPLETGSIYLDVYRVASGEKTIQVRLDSRGILSDESLRQAVWISDRHLVFPINRRQTELMVCDLGPLQGGPGPVWDPAANAEILGFREEPTMRDIAGTLGNLALYFGVRVGESGSYWLTAIVEDAQGRRVNASERAELLPGMNQIRCNVTPGRSFDGELKIRDVKLERVIGKDRTEVARRDVVGTIGPYRMVAPEWKPRADARSALSRWPQRAVKRTAVVSSPLKTSTIPGRVENLTGVPAAGAKIDTLRLRVAIPPVAGDCTWVAALRSAGRFLTNASVSVNSVKPQEAVVFEFQLRPAFRGNSDGEVEFSDVSVSCRGDTGAWHHQFDEFPGYVVPGIRASMLLRAAIPDSTPSATFTGENKVELIDSDHDGKNDVLKVTVGFRSERECSVGAMLKDPHGLRSELGYASYNPRAGNKNVVFYLQYMNVNTAEESSLEQFQVWCDHVPTAYDKTYRLPLGRFSVKRFEAPFQLTYESEQPVVENGAMVYRVNCMPRWTLDIPLDFTAHVLAPDTEVSFGSAAGAVQGARHHVALQAASEFAAFPVQRQCYGNHSNRRNFQFCGRCVAEARNT